MDLGFNQSMLQSVVTFCYWLLSQANHASLFIRFVIITLSASWMCNWFWYELMDVYRVENKANKNTK